MGSVSEENYKYICDILLNTCIEVVNHNNLQDLKLKYMDIIKSTRRLENISSINDLIKVLEKRGSLSSKNISLLYEIADFYNKRYILEAFNNDINLNSTAISAVYSPGDTHFRQTLPITPNPAYDVKARVHVLISTQLEKSWIDFARALNVQECKIDDLKMKYPHQRKVCVAEILENHERNAHPRVWKTELLEALTKARRNDLRKSVQNIFDTYS